MRTTVDCVNSLDLDLLCMCFFSIRKCMTYWDFCFRAVSSEQHAHICVTACFSCRLHSAFCSGELRTAVRNTGELMRRSAGGPGRHVSAACSACSTVVWYESHRLSSLAFKVNERCRGLQWAGFIISTPASPPNSCPRLNVSLTPTNTPPPLQSSRQSLQREQRQWHESPRYPYQGMMSLLITLLTQIFSGFWLKWFDPSDVFQQKNKFPAQFQTKHCLFSQKPPGKSSISVPQLHKYENKNRRK